jgi:geranylgeranyl pyrophosphate synthase
MRRPPQSSPTPEVIGAQMEQVERLVAEATVGVEEPLRSMLQHVLSGGKRLRPKLVLLVVWLFMVPDGRACRLGAALETLHAATLVHDDMVDESPLRRGCRTLHSTWSNSASVLAGDYLLARSMGLLASLGLPRILEVIAEALRALCAGEIGQAFGSRDGPWDRKAYFLGIQSKTASLFAAAAESAGILAGATETQVATLQRFGLELGMAFQIVDDVLDLTGDEQSLGKPAGSDLRQGLVTLPTLLYLERARDGDAVQPVLSGARDHASMRTAVDAICASGAIEDALAEAGRHTRRCQDALRALPDGEARRALSELTALVLARNR